MRLIARPTDDCALEHGYYTAQTDAVARGVNRIVDADVDHDLVDALVTSHIHFLLSLPGTVHIFSLDGALPLVRIGDIENVPPPGGVAPPITADQIVPESIPSYPGGIAGCKKISYFLGNFSDKDWCQQEARKEIMARCTTQEDKAACVRDYFSDWIAPSEFGSAACAVYSERHALGECLQKDFVSMITVFNNMGKEWAAILPVVNADPDVVDALQEVKQCLASKGFDNPPGKFLYPWQGFMGNPSAQEAFLAGLSTSETEQVHSLVAPSQQCGVQEGFFAAQESALAAEVRRLQSADPGKVAHLQQWGLLGAIEQPGIIHDLHGPSLPPP